MNFSLSNLNDIFYNLYINNTKNEIVLHNKSSLTTIMLEINSIWLFPNYYELLNRFYNLYLSFLKKKKNAGRALNLSKTLQFFSNNKSSLKLNRLKQIE